MKRSIVGNLWSYNANIERESVPLSSARPSEKSPIGIKWRELSVDARILL